MNLESSHNHNSKKDDNDPPDIVNPFESSTNLHQEDGENIHRNRKKSTDPTSNLNLDKPKRKGEPHENENFNVDGQNVLSQDLFPVSVPVNPR